MSERLPKHLHDALRAARLALDFLRDTELAAYEANALLRSAIERQVEIVGEACRRALDDEPALRERMPECALAIAIRNRIAHGYDSVDNLIVLNTVKGSFPSLAERLVQELARFPGA
jgi:uncharacterized protein with HEPN domain